MSTPSPCRIVHAAENIKGGVGTYLRDLVVAQRASFGDGAVVVVVPETQSDILASPAGVEVVTFDNRGPRWLGALRLALKMRLVLRRVDASVVHLHSTFAGLALRPLLRWFPVNTRRRPVVIYCAHGWSFDRETSAGARRLAMWLERMLAPLCDAVVCISAHEMRLGLRAGIPAKRLTHVGNGIPAIRPDAQPVVDRPYWPQDKRRLLFVGRFDRQKGVDTLIEALGELRESTFAYLVGNPVLGDAPLPSLPDNVRVTGWLSGPALAAYYETADVLVAPSRWEGFGLTAVEAMRAGLLVIATRVGGLAEVVEHGVTGLLVEPGSSTALVEAIRSTSAESLQSMGAAGRQRFRAHFTLDRMHAQLTGLYQRLHSRNGVAAAFVLLLLASGARVSASTGTPREPGDPFRVELSQAMTRDSNLYRLPDGIDAAALSPDSTATRDDVVSCTSVSADGGWEFGRQAVALDVNVDANRYADNDALDNTSGNSRVDWDWQLARGLSGQLGGSYGRSLSGFVNSRFLGRDVLETSDYHGAVRYQLTPHWSLNGQASVADGSHDTASRSQDDFETTASAFSVGYLTRRGDQLGLEYRRTATAFPEETPGSVLFASRRYIDRTANFNLQYAFTVKTSLQASAGYVWRHYPDGVIGDFAGATWNASLHWEPRAKTRVTIAQWRELKAYLDSESNHFESRGSRLTVAWLPTARQTFAFEVSAERHDYVGFDAGVLSQPGRQDRLRSAKGSFTWQPRQRLALDLAYGFEQRDSTRPLFDFDDRVGSATLRLIF